MRQPLLRPPEFLGLSRKRLQTLYLAAAAGLAALVPLILFAGFWMRSELSKTHRDVETFLGARALSLSQLVDAEVEHQLAALRALAVLPLADDVALFEESAPRLTAAMPSWSSLSLIEAESQRVIFSTRPAAIPTPDRARVTEAALDRRSMIEARPGPSARDGAVLLYVPVVRDGVARFVLLTTFEEDAIQAIVANQSREANLVSMVVDDQDRVLATSLESNANIGDEITPSLREAIRNRHSGLFEAGLGKGEIVTGAFQRSSFTGWVSFAAFEEGQGHRLGASSAWATIGAGLLSLALAGILAVFIIHTVMERRVSDERLSASRALGELDARLLATSQEALGEQRKAAHEREVLLREIYHRVKNNLQIVQSLLRLGSRELKPEQREPFESAVRRIGAMARVHTLLYSSPDLASIDFKDYLDELLKELADGFAASEREIEHVLEAEPTRVSLDTAVPLAFVAVEILTNSFKHAFPHGRRGRITVDIHREGDEAVLTIRDNGVGMATDAANKRRLGLTIVRKLVQQIGGALEEPPPGSSVFIVRFPVAPKRAAGDQDKPAPVPETVQT